MAHKALTVIGVGVFVVLLAAVGIYTFVIAVSTKLHPNPKDVPSVALAAPSPRWAAADRAARRVRGRQASRGSRARGSNRSQIPTRGTSKTTRG